MPECAGCCESNAIKGKTDETIDCSFLNVAVIAAVLIGYNTVLDKRDKEDQIARLSAELETTQLQKENLQAAAAASTRRIRPQVKQQKQKGSTWTVRMTVKLTASAAPLQLK